ncbi:MAG: hypothetical protein HY819_15135 [Acidobacteria bacterium]|nr:hypothetical protein [Acidobacteriota bacterium]
MFKLSNNFLAKLQTMFILLALVLFGGVLAIPNTTILAQQVKVSKEKQTRFPTYFEGFVTGVQGNTIEVLNGSLAFDLSKAKIVSGSEDLNISSIAVGSVVRIDYFQPSGKEQKKGATGAKSLVKSEDVGSVIVQKMASVELGGFFGDVNLDKKSFKIYGYEVFVNNETKGQISVNNELKNSVDLEILKSFKKGGMSVSAKLVEDRLVATSLFAFELDGQIPQGSRYLGTIRGYVTDVKGTMVEILGGKVSLDLAPIAEDVKIASLKDGYVYASSHSSEFPVSSKLEAIAGTARYKNEVFFSGSFAKDQRQSVIIFSGVRLLVNENTLFIESDEDDDGNAKILGKGSTGLALLKNSGFPLAVFVTVNGNSLIATDVIVSAKALN